MKESLHTPSPGIADDIVGSWLSTNHTEYLFLPITSEFCTGIVSIKQSPVGGPVLFTYSFKIEDDKIFLEIENCKYPLILLETDDERTLMIQVSKDYVIELKKK